MKLRNKDDGRVREFGIDETKSFSYYLRDELGNTYWAKTLKEIADKWEEIEEPKEHWYIAYNGIVECFEYDDWQYMEFNWQDKLKQIGNYFETKEEAEQAVRRLKAFKRLRDKGFEFNPVDKYEALCGNGFNIPITATMPPEAYTDVEVSKDLDTCFGGEE